MWTPPRQIDDVDPAVDAQAGGAADQVWRVLELDRADALEHLAAVLELDRPRPQLEVLPAPHDHVAFELGRPSSSG